MDMVAKMLEEERFNYDDALEYGRMEGLQQGFKEGKSIGFADGKKAGIKTGESNGAKIRSLEIAKNMLLEKFDLGIVSKITDIPVNKLKQLQKNVQ